ncbi:MAG TPA: hypothetical protein VKR79_01475 [Gaiellaceae bacterium]|nr:hypothetical protein [Gaiellaceae bacterium]
MRKARVGGIAVAAALLAAGVALLVPEPAAAIVNSGCTAALNGTDLTDLPADPGNAVVVGKDEVVPMTMTSTNGKTFDRLEIQLVFGGFGWDVYNAPAGGGTWSQNVDVHSFARGGVGLYEIKGIGHYSDGTTCSGRAFIKVSGDPFGTVAGITAAAASGAGVLSVLGAGIAAGGENGPGGGGSGGGGGGTPYTEETAERDAAREEARKQDERAYPETVYEAQWGRCFLLAIAALPLFLLLGAGSMLMAVVPVRARWTPRISVVGVIGGLLTGLGAGTLLQEYAIVYPSRTWALIYILGGIAFGLAVPSLARVRAVRRWNRRHA